MHTKSLMPPHIKRAAAGGQAAGDGLQGICYQLRGGSSITLCPRARKIPLALPNQFCVSPKAWRRWLRSVAGSNGQNGRVAPVTPKEREVERRCQLAKLLKCSSPAERRAIQSECRIGRKLRRELEAI